jgi:hypothetical protein
MTQKDSILISLLTVALLLSISGTFLVVGNGNFLTGAATASSTGQVNLSITSTTAITSQISIVDFGSGYVDSTFTECIMASNGQHNQTGASCVGFTNVTDGFYLENTGNFNISVNYSCNGNCTAQELIGGTGSSFQVRVLSAFERNGSGQTNDTVRSCQAYNDGSSAAIFNGWNISPGGRIAAGQASGLYGEVGTTQNGTLCGNTTHFPLSPTNAYDAAVIDINLTIPEDAPGTSANSTATFTINAMSAG